MPAGYHDPQGRHGGITLHARPEPIAFDADATALIVVDMQNAYATKGGYLDLAGFDVSSTGPAIDRIALAVAAPSGTLTETAPQQWVETVPGKGERILAQRHIQDVTYYRFKAHWDFVPDSPN